MKIKGQHQLSTDIATLWPMLQDEAVLARISPGVSDIVRLEEDQYKAISDISIGPVRGKFEGLLNIVDKKEHETMTLELEQKSKIGNAKASIKMNLTETEGNTTMVAYEGSAKLSGTLATMGQRIMGGVIKTLSKQVFKELEKVIEERQGEEQVTVTETASETSPEVVKEASSQTVEEVLDSNNPSGVLKEHQDISEREKIETVVEENTETKEAIKRKSFLQSLIDKILNLWK